MAPPPLSFAAPKNKFYVNGKWVSAIKESSTPLDVVNPADGSVLYTVAAGSGADVDAACAAASKAFYEGSWRNTTGKDRAVVLRKIAKAVAERKPELSKIECADSGKPLREAEWDLDDVSGCFDYYAKLAEQLDEEGETPVTDIPADYAVKFNARTRRTPVGVVAAITPWNYPLLMVAWKVAPALAAGCTIIVKPSEVTPLSTLELADIIHKHAELPDGVFNVIVGTGPEVGAPLSSHPLVDKVGFTGSVATGRAIAHAAVNSPLIKNVSLELGGKSPFLVFDDVDIDEAAEWIAFGVWWTNGQICSSTSRLLIHENVAEKVLARVAQIAASIHVGDPFTEANPSMGPLVNKAQQQKVLGYIEIAKAEGATVLCGGAAPTNAECKNGFFVQPTVLVGVKENHRVWNEEIFGPVLSVMKFTDEKEAIAIANRNEFGLAAAVMTKDEARLRRVSRQLRAGIVWLNCSQPAFAQCPWGGYKNSGNGTRDLGPWGLDNYLETQSFVEYTAPPGNWGWFIKEQAKL